MGLEHVIARRSLSREAAGEGAARPDPAAMDRAIVRSWLTPQRAVAAALTLLTLAIGAYGYVTFGLARRVSVDADRLTVSPVERAVFHDFIPLTGTVQPEKTVFLDIPQSGQVVERLVEEGAMVSDGQPIVRLKNTALELQVSTEQQQLAQALYQINAQKMQIDDLRLSRRVALDAIEGEIAMAEKKLARMKILVEHDTVPRADAEDLETQLAQQKRQRATDREALDLANRSNADQTAQIQQALGLIRRNLEELRRNLDDLVIHAPISGQLTTLDAEIGAFKSAGGRIGQIDRTDAYKLTCLVDEFYLGRLSVGQTASGKIEGQEIGFRVMKIHPEVKDRQFAVDLAFGGPPPASVRRGQTLRVRLEIGDAGESVIVANGPFYDDSGGRWAFVVSPSGGKALRRPVTLGRRTIDAVEVLSGLDPGEKIVTSGYADFEKIDIIDIRNSRGDSRS